MKRLLSVALTTGLLLAAPPAWSIAFDFTSTGQVVASDCGFPLPPQPLCVDIAGPAQANDVPDAIPGSWVTTLAGQVLFFVGNGTFYYDDPSVANNDFFGTWHDVLGAPDASGIAQADFTYVVLGGSGIFAGLTGSGTSIVHVVVAPAGFDPNGAPIFAAACPGSPAGIGGFCESGHFDITEPQTAALLALAAFALRLASRRRAKL